MKRSEINTIIRDTLKFFKEQNVHLPTFCNWTPEDWADIGHEADEIRDNMLGWDITDYGQGDFNKVGLLLVTTRNGNQKNPAKYPKPYAEKYLVIRENQVTPMHYHWSKMEDIINRGGGNLIIKLYNSTENDELADTDVTVSVDGVTYTYPAGYELKLLPGQGITLTQGLFHRFWGEEGHGTVLVVEVSMCNDDTHDNNFYDKVGRFPEITEDEAPLFLLCNEYPAAK